MITGEMLTLFFSVSFVLALSPGPDNIFVFLQSAMHGSRSGLIVVSGLCSGLLVHILLVAFGVAALIAASPVLFTLLTYFGALYLLYLAFLSVTQKQSGLNKDSVKPLRTLQLYRRGILMNLSNPKVILFFLAYFPQFIDTSGGNIAMQSILLGAVFIGATLLVFGSVALLSGTFAQMLFVSQKAQKLLHTAAAAVFTLMALHLLIA